MSKADKVEKTEPVRKPDTIPYLNRELSWLAFNRRVLEQATSEKNPLLERLKFLSIVSSNLDEFFEVRVAGLLQQVKSGITKTTKDGLSPQEQLQQIHKVTESLVTDQHNCFKNGIVPALRREGILFLTPSELSKNDRKWIDSHFTEEVFPVMTPLAIDPAHPFPQIINKSLNILVSVKHPQEPESGARMAILPVPRILPRIVKISNGSQNELRFVFLSDIIKLNAASLFPGFEVTSALAFRITRNSDLYIDEEEAENFLEEIEEELKNRQKGAAVRLEIKAGVDPSLLERLLEHIGLTSDFIFKIDGPINLTRLMSLYDQIDRPDLKYRPFQPAIPSALTRHSSLFTAISERDRLLHHPYDSFSPVVDFIQQAARDPKVIAIKQTLYRTSGDSPIVRALIEASQNGKQVTALIELKARFDEANNIEWAKQLEEAGVQVVYGMVGYKVHCKTCLIVRREKQGLRHYAHIATGNYNPITARIYVDLSLFTASPDITGEIALLFNAMTGFGRTPEFSRLLVAPYNLHNRLLSLIQTETENAQNGKPARIIAKLNSFVDQGIIDALYEASRAGVKIDLIVRGTCCLIPGIPGLSENIRVRSIVGRFLEHSRICHFLNSGGEPLYFAGSADWMPRNFFRRIEVVFPIDDPKLREQIAEILETCLLDTADARELQPSGNYTAIDPGGDPPLSAQNTFLKNSS